MVDIKKFYTFSITPNLIEMARKKRKIGLLVRILIAIAAGILVGLVSPDWLTRIAVTFTTLFGNFLNFVIPIIILGLVAPGIAELGKGAGKLLALTVALAYGSTIFSGLFTYGVSIATFPSLLDGTTVGESIEQADALAPYFTIEMPPVFGVMSALLLAFILGITLASIPGQTMKNVLSELREVVNRVIAGAIVPILPLYIFFIFLNMAATGQAGEIMSVFAKIIVVIFALHIVLLVLYYVIAALVAGGNPFRYLKNMLPAYMTALGTQSSAATIPVTLEQSIKNGVSKEIAGFVVPLCATIHLAGSIMKITACAIAIMMITGTPFTFGMMLGFILMLGVAMVAAPGVPGGAIMAALGVLASMLGFDDTMLALMIALYIAMDSFGTACNVTGDGAIAIVINRIYKKRTGGSDAAVAQDEQPLNHEKFEDTTPAFGE